MSSMRFGARTKNQPVTGLHVQASSQVKIIFRQRLTTLLFTCRERI